MRQLKKLLVLILACGLMSCSKGPQVSLEKKAPPAPRIEGEVVFMVDSPSALQGITEEGTIQTVDAQSGIYMVRSQSFGGQEAKVAERLASRPGVVFAEPNYQLQAHQIPRDPKWFELWGLKNYGQDAPNGTEGEESADIKALEAWKVTTGSRNVVVAIIDTGIDYTHPDLKENIWINEKELRGIEGVDDDDNGYADDKYGWDFVSGLRQAPYHGQLGDPDPMDDNKHGTHVAGTIGAVGNNGIGVAGINWSVQLMGLKFLDKNGSGNTVDAYRAIRYAARNKAQVINASWGGGGPSKLLAKAIADAGREGVLFVAAAGNDGSDNDNTPSFPASYPLENIIAVAATDNRDQLAEFSNYGYETVHIAAPGVAITSTVPVASKPESPYDVFSGTSMATPHVAGAAALVIAANPGLMGKPYEVKQRLIQSVDWKPNLAGRVSSGGRLNLLNAIKGVQSTGSQLSQNWVEEAYSLQTPRHPTEKLDQVWTVKKEGAASIQLHVQSSMIDSPFDVAMIYDALYRPITSLPEMAADFWLPAVAGDTVHLKFSNGVVAVQEATSVTVKDPSEVPDASFCAQPPGSEDWECTTLAKGSDFVNFHSEGVVIDRLRYVPATITADSTGGSR